MKKHSEEQTAQWLQNLKVKLPIKLTVFKKKSVKEIK